MEVPLELNFKDKPEESNQTEQASQPQNHELVQDYDSKMDAPTTNVRSYFI